MVARLAALGALDAEGTVHKDSLRLCCLLCLIVRFLRTAETTASQLAPRG